MFPLHKTNRYTFIILFLLLLIAAMANGQSLTQTVRGKITDQDSQSGLPGVNVIVMESNPTLGGSTNENGEFRIENVPVGRVSLKISYVGYEDRVMPNVLVSSGKEVLLNIEMRESLTNMKEIVIKANADKSEIANEMAMVSARGFTVEETKRYAGSLNDPARMVSGYAGVDTDPSGNNSIIVRGNSPKGIQWRLEGIEIPNPNHFSDEGATGGPINALNSQMLANSEFYSGAFAPQYGNALSGVFDMKLRNGNDEQREHSFSIGILGTDITTEGPFKKGGRSSYLLNYRYSTLTLLTDLGIMDFDGVPKYQDMSFKVHLPTNSLGTFSIFGLGGKSSIIEKLYDEDNEDLLLEQGDYQADMGVIGVTQYLSLGSKAYLQNSVSISTNGSRYLGYEPNSVGDLVQLDDSKLDKNSIRATSTWNRKLNAAHNFQVGAIYTHHSFDFFNKYFDEAIDEFVTNQDNTGTAGHYQGFLSWKYRPWDNLSLVTGVHAHGTTLNEGVSFEPRLGMRWQFRPTQTLTAGFGVHGKMESLTNYFAKIENQEGVVLQPNTNIGFSKANHYVLGYENRLGGNLLMKIEAYYQKLYNIPVENDRNSSYSLINQVEWFSDRLLVNEGKGRNLGMEFTLERYFADNYFFLITGSLYDSKYTAKDGIQRDTRFNGNYVGNVLFGKEFELKSNNSKKKVIGINSKVSLLGARRYTPINLEESILQDDNVLFENRAFTNRGDDIFIANLAISYRIDRKKTSQELKLDIQNVTNNQATLGFYYDDDTDQVESFEQLSLLPVLMYTIHF